MSITLKVSDPHTDTSPPAKTFIISEYHGETIWELVKKKGIRIKASCGGKGKCEKCSVLLTEGDFISGSKQIHASSSNNFKVPACITVITGTHAEITIPHETLAEVSGSITDDFSDLDYEINPGTRKYCLTLPAGTLGIPSSDVQMLEDALLQNACISNTEIPLSVLTDIPYALRKAERQITVTIGQTGQTKKMLSVEPGNTAHSNYGIAVDIGTTTVVCILADLASGRIAGKASQYNSQITAGDDVISRIEYCSTPGKLKELKNLIVNTTLNILIADVCRQSGILPEKICRAAVSGNTVMMHLFLGVDPYSIGVLPFHPAVQFPESYYAGSIGLSISETAIVDIIPAVSGYIGGDITADMYASKIIKEKKLTLLIDVGTNGEMVMCEDGKLTACATAAGPAFEGYGLYSGCRASDGAIEKVSFDKNNTLHIQTIQGSAPIGICGSGIIDFLAEGLRIGIINTAGRFDMKLLTELGLAGSAEVNGSAVHACVLADEKISANGKAILITEPDISKILQAKAAIFAGIKTMLLIQNKQITGIEKIILAGGFARHIQIPHAIRIGMLPDIPVEKYINIGNGALAGAYISLLDKKALSDMNELARLPHVIELNQHPSFQDLFTDALFLPDISTTRYA